MNNELLREESTRWNNLTNKGPKDLWAHIDWKGNLTNKKVNCHPSINELLSHFENVFTAEDPTEVSKINASHSSTYIPVIDDTIKGKEIEEALDTYKKSGYDFNLNVLQILVSRFLSIRTAF